MASPVLSARISGSQITGVSGTKKVQHVFISYPVRYLSVPIHTYMESPVLSAHTSHY